MARSNTYRLAVIPGDGIGKEVVPEGLRVLEAVARKHKFSLDLDHFDFSSCDYYEKHGKMLPDDWKTQIGSHDAIYFGAVGMPDRVPDHISLWGSLLLFRREFDQYVNLRPVKLMPGVPSPLANRKPGDIDFFVVRENTEGEYSSVGGRMYPGTEREIVLQQTVMSRVGVDRILKYAFELARKRPRKKVTSATKSNGIFIAMPYWDERVAEMKKQYPDVTLDQYHIDILTAHFVLNPTVSMLSWPRTCSAISFPILDRLAPAPSASRRPATSTRSGSSPPSSSPCMARRQISRARASRTPSGRSGPQQ